MGFGTAIKTGFKLLGKLAVENPAQTAAFAGAAFGT